MELHRADLQRSNSCFVADPDVNLPLCHTPSSYQPLHRVANMNNRSGIKYPRATRYVSKVNVYNICNKCTFA